jgi:large subunit ribosomal protein L1
MGKIRVKGFDEATPEEEAKLKAKKEAKKAEKMAAKNAQRASEGKKVNPQSEEMIASITTDEPKSTEATVEEKVTVETVEEEKPARLAEDETKPAKKAKKEKFAKAKGKTESKRHKSNLTLVSKTQTYTIDQALEALKKFKKSSFDETVELHINTKEKGISGQVILPHGTGKTLVIKVADDTIIAEVAKGKINFDVLVATPSMMPQLARVAKILGPRGLMPNPKNGTITEDTASAVKKLAGGQINFKTESEAPIIHARVGKISFDDAKLKENIKTFITSVGNDKISNVTLKSTMSPAVRLDYLSL